MLAEWVAQPCEYHPSRIRVAWNDFVASVVAEVISTTLAFFQSSEQMEDKSMNPWVSWYEYQMGIRSKINVHREIVYQHIQRRSLKLEVLRFTNRLGLQKRPICTAPIDRFGSAFHASTTVRSSGCSTNIPSPFPYSITLLNYTPLRPMTSIAPLSHSPPYPSFLLRCLSWDAT